MEWSKRGTQLFAGTVLMAALSTIAVALRFFSRGRILRVLGPTDWFLALTLFFCIGNTASVGVHVAYGLGWPQSTLPVEQLRKSLRVQYVAILINNLSLVLTKVSVCLLFLDVFLVTSVRKATYVVLVAVILHGTYVTLTNIFFCTPTHNYWDKPFNNNCIDIRVKFNVDNGLNILINFVMLCLPVPAIWPMTLPWRQKLWLLVLFILGFGVCAVSVLRVIFIRHDIIGNHDLTTAAIRIVFWSIMEINLPIIISCIPTLRPLATKIYPGLVMTPIATDSSGHPPTISSAPIRLRSVQDNVGHMPV